MRRVRPLKAEEEIGIEPPRLWVPEQLTGLQRTFVGHLSETGENVWAYHCHVQWRGEDVHMAAVAEESASQAQVEDMLAKKCERELKKIALKIEERGGKIRSDKLSPAMRKEVAGALREFKKWRDRRRADPTSKLYF